MAIENNHDLSDARGVLAVLDTLRREACKRAHWKKDRDTILSFLLEIECEIEDEIARAKLAALRKYQREQRRQKNGQFGARD